MTEDIKYAVIVLHRWDTCELTGFPSGIFGGMNGSIGFMPVFDDLEKLKAAYPAGATIMKMAETGASK